MSIRKTVFCDACDQPIICNDNETGIAVVGSIYTVRDNSEPENSDSPRPELMLGGGLVGPNISFSKPEPRNINAPLEDHEYNARLENISYFHQACFIAALPGQSRPR